MVSKLSENNARLFIPTPDPVYRILTLFPSGIQDPVKGHPIPGSTPPSPPSPSLLLLPPLSSSNDPVLRLK